MGWYMLFGGLWMLIFWVGIVWLVVWGAARGDRGRSHDEAPMEIARRRYAKGEITKEQFDQLRHDLG